MKVTIVANATRPGTITNVAGVTAGQRDPDPRTSFARAIVRIVPAPPPPPVTG